VVYGQQSWREMFEGWLIFSERTEENANRFDELYQANPLQNGEDKVGEDPIEKEQN
jgi:hypothetical protein